MLPTLEIDFTEVCHIEPDVLGDRQRKIVGYTSVYNSRNYEELLLQ
jgi:hypothetical protein